MMIAIPESSGNQAADAAILAVRGYLFGATLHAGTDAATLVVYDNATAASGTVVARLAAAAATVNHVWFEPPVRVTNGIYADVSGTSPNYVVYRAPGA